MALVTGTCTFVNVVCTQFVDLIARVCTAFPVGVLGVLAVHVAMLKILVLARGGILFVAHIGTASIAITPLTVLASTMISVVTLRAA